MRRVVAPMAVAAVLACVGALAPASAEPGGDGGGSDGSAVADTASDGQTSGDAISVVNINNASQSSVNDAWFDELVPALAEPSGWTGSVSGCNAGTTSQAAYDATLRTVNWVREMAGVGQITDLPSMRAQLQQTALMMKANNALSHDPPNSWLCWTQTGRDGAAANLTRGAGFGTGNFNEGYGANAFMSQMRDAGESNVLVGHRRFNIDPRATQFSAGFTDTTAAIWPEYDDPFGRQPTPLFVPWPSAGYFPAPAEPAGRWSLSVHREAILTNATVTVTPEGGSPAAMTVHPPGDGLADDTIVFDLTTIPAPFPNGNPRSYTVTVSNIGDEQNNDFFPGVTIPTSFTYTVTLFNPVDSTPSTAPGTPTGLQATPGDGQVALSWVAPASDGGSPIISYRVFRNGTQIHQTANGSTLSFTDTGRTNGVQYGYQVAAVNAVGESVKTATVNATPTGSDPDGPCLPASFTDVGPSSTFFEDICWMALEGISTGFQPGPVYRPGQVVTRQSMSAFMYRLAGSPAYTPPGTPSFSDVGTGNTFYQEIEWMNAEGITTGFPGGLFKPGQAVTRQSMSAFMYRLAGSPAFPDPPTASFGDVPTSSQFFTEVEWMVDEGITTGFPGGLFKPGQAVTRQAMSAFMHRLADGPGVNI